MKSEQNSELICHLKLYGDRNSSVLAAYPGFKSFQSPPAFDGQIRYAETQNWWIGATEPLSEKNRRAELFQIFSKAASKNGKRSMLVPVSESLSALLLKKGFSRLQVGAEAIFDLEQYFSKQTKDPLERFEHASRLLKKGARLREVVASDISPSLKAKLDKLLVSWKESLRTIPLHFLNQVNPWQYADLKKFFLLEFRGEILAFLAASPIFPRLGFFYADYVRGPLAKPGSMELLLIESMRQLHKQGYKEVSLGLCPLAQLEKKFFVGFKDRLWMSLMNFVFSRTTFPFSFQSIFQFKSKLKPTRWEPLFLVSQERSRFRVFASIMRAHFPNSIFTAVAKWLEPRLKTLLRSDFYFPELPQTLFSLLQRVRLTLLFTTLFSVLHGFKEFNEVTRHFFNSSAFLGVKPTLQGWFIGPLFHNNHFHFFGDVVSFLLLGSVLELLLGPIGFLVITSLGLWASNPVTSSALYYPLQIWNPDGLTRLLTEPDYGSSNAVYAYVGALAVLFRSSRWLITPFLLNAVFLLIAKESWLSFHHFFALGMGYIAAHLYVFKRLGNSKAAKK